MEEELLIDFNESLKIQQSFGGPRDEASSNTGNEVKPGLTSHHEGTSNSSSKVITDMQENCIFDNQYDELTPQLNLPIITNSQPNGIESANLIALSPFNCPKVNKTNTCEADLMAESTPTLLMSPFGCPVKVRSKGIILDVNEQNSVPVGQLLPEQDDLMPSITLDVFDIETLQKKCDIKLSSASEDLSQNDHESRLTLPSIPSTVSDGSVYSSFGTINNGFLESKSPPSGRVDLSQSPNDSVFQEAKAIAQEFSRLAKFGADAEGIECETGSILSSCSDLDDIDIADMDLIGNELDNLVDIYSVENKDDVVEEGCLKNIMLNTPKMEFKNSSEAGLLDRARPISSSSSRSISPLPLSTERFNRMKLKPSEPAGASLKLASSKKNVSTCPNPVPGRGGPLKALVPLSQIIKNSVSPIGIVPAKPRGVKISESSPDFLRPVSTSDKIMSSTPILKKPSYSTNLISSVKKGLNGNIKGVNNRKSNCEATLTQSGLRLSSTGRTQEAGKHSSIARPVATGVRKASIPSPVIGKRYSGSTPNVRTPVARSSSTGHLPLTPSMMKVNGAANTQAFQSPLKRSNSLSAKLSVGTPSRIQKMSSASSPAKGATSLDKLISKFRRVSASRGMKENVSPGKY